MGVFMSTITTSVRIDSNLKREADALFSELGLTFSSAINAFLKQSVREQGLPFRLTMDIPNAETIAAMKEAEALLSEPNAKSFMTVEELFEDLDS